MKRDDWYFAAFLFGIYLIFSLVVHGELLKSDLTYCIGLALGSLLGARRVHERSKRGEA